MLLCFGKLQPDIVARNDCAVLGMMGKVDSWLLRDVAEAEPVQRHPARLRHGRPV